MASSRTACSARTGSDNQPVMHLCATGLRISKFFNSGELNKIVEATMRVSPYDDGWVCMRWQIGKDDLNIVRVS